MQTPAPASTENLQGTTPLQAGGGGNPQSIRHPATTYTPAYSAITHKTPLADCVPAVQLERRRAKLADDRAAIDRLLAFLAGDFDALNLPALAATAQQLFAARDAQMIEAGNAPDAPGNDAGFQRHRRTLQVLADNLSLTARLNRAAHQNRKAA